MLEIGEPSLDVAKCDITKPALTLNRVDYSTDGLRRLAVNDSSIYDAGEVSQKKNDGFMGLIHA